MLELRIPHRNASNDEAEKPFWISFSDLMTALMVLFLVAMAVALMAVTQGLRGIKEREQARQETIDSCMGEIKTITQNDEFKGVTIRGTSIEFGTLAEFRNNDHRLEVDQERFVR